MSPFLYSPVLASVDADLVSVNEDIASKQDLLGLNLFLSPSQVIDGKREEMGRALLRHMHHRSAELPSNVIRKDKKGGAFGVRRLKGNGLYSGPARSWMHKVRNIKKDQTGLILGLQAKEEYDESLANSCLLREMGIETEIPEGAFLLKEIIFRTRAGVRRLPIEEAIARAHLPAEYKEIPFVIRVDALGVNHRLKDFMFADELLSSTRDSNLIRETMLKEASDFVVEEAKITRGEEPYFLKHDIAPYIRFIINRIMRNLGILHKNGGVHGQLTAQNLTLDGKFIDYDTLKWKPKGAELNSGKGSDLKKIIDNLREFLRVVFDFGNFKSRRLDNVIEDSLRIYKCFSE